MPDASPHETGGCRSLLSAGCLVVVAAFCAAAAAFIAALFALFWVGSLIWSLLAG